jgi:hypothetical protein
MDRSLRPVASSGLFGALEPEIVKGMFKLFTFAALLRGRTTAIACPPPDKRKIPWVPIRSTKSITLAGTESQLHGSVAIMCP